MGAYVLALAGNGGVVLCSYTVLSPHSSIIMGDVCAMLRYVVCPVLARYGPCEGEAHPRNGNLPRKHTCKKAEYCTDWSASAAGLLELLKVLPNSMLVESSMCKFLRNLDHLS